MCASAQPRHCDCARLRTTHTSTCTHGCTHLLGTCAYAHAKADTTSNASMCASRRQGTGIVRVCARQTHKHLHTWLHTLARHLRIRSCTRAHSVECQTPSLHMGRGIRLRMSVRVCASASVIAFLCPFVHVLNPDVCETTVTHKPLSTTIHDTLRAVICTVRLLASLTGFWRLRGCLQPTATCGSHPLVLGTLCRVCATSPA